MVDWFAPAIGLIGAVLGAVVGATISYMVQTKTQKGAWKKEIAETVYYNLYSNVKAIKTSLESGKFDRVSFATWDEFQNDHRYLHVRPEKFREQLDGFLKKIDEYDRDMIRLINEVFPDIVQEASEKIFNLKDQEISIYVKYKQPSGRFEAGYYTPVFCLRERKHPRELIMESFPDSEIISFSVNFRNLPPMVGNPSIITDEAKFNEFWKLCKELEEKNKTYKLSLQKHGALLKESTSIFEELTKRITDIIP